MTVDPLAQAVMVAYCGWDPTAIVADATELLDGDGSPVLFLPSLQVTDVTSVTITCADGSTWTPTVGPGMNVGWSANGTLTWNCFGYWPVGQQNVSVVWSGGYTDEPADLDAALCSVSNRIPRMGRTSSKLGSAAFTYAASVADGGLLLVEQMVFDRYRIPRAR